MLSIKNSIVFDTRLRWNLSLIRWLCFAINRSRTSCLTLAVSWVCGLGSLYWLWRSSWSYSCCYSTQRLKSVEPRKPPSQITTHIGSKGIEKILYFHLSLFKAWLTYSQRRAYLLFSASRNSKKKDHLNNLHRNIITQRRQAASTFLEHAMGKSFTELQADHWAVTVARRSSDWSS